MEDSGYLIPEIEREEETLIAAAKHIVSVLGSKKNLTVDAKKILADLGAQLSTMSILYEEGKEVISLIEERLNCIQEKIMGWEEDQSMIWDSGPEEVTEYLNASDEARQLVDRLEAMGLSKEDEEYELLQRAHNILQTAMARLEEEFRHMFIQNRQPFEPEYVSFRSSEEDVVDANSIFSTGDDSVEDSFRRDSVSRASEEHIIDLVHPHVIPELKSIANLMFASNYNQECAHAYTISRRDALDECLFILEIERLSIEDVLKMEWGALHFKIKRWVRAMKIFVRVYLASEKWLINQIFGEEGPVTLKCFVEASKASILQLLNFGEAMSIGPHQPEKMIGILDIYEVLAELVPDIDALYPYEIGSGVRTECHDLLRKLADCVRATFFVLENAIASNVSSTPFAGGGIHPLTRYVMNYMRTLTDYSETLISLFLKDQDEDTAVAFSPNMSLDIDEENRILGSAPRFSSMTFHFRSVASVLECNLDEKSKLYKDISLQHFFMMNNIYYMAQKVKGSELRRVYGDEWIRKHNWIFQQHAMNYERASWSSILPLLRDEGIQNHGTDSFSKTLLKERLRSFYLAFEDIYKTQTAWLIPDVQLREDLRISISLTVIRAYRTFVGRHNNHISEKHIKYSADDLESSLLDFFEGSPKSLQNPHRR